MQQTLLHVRPEHAYVQQPLLHVRPKSAHAEQTLLDVRFATQHHEHELLMKPHARHTRTKRAPSVNLTIALRDLREHEKISQDVLAGIVGVSKRTMSKWACRWAFPSRAQALEVIACLNERGRSDPALLAALAEAMGVAPFVAKPAQVAAERAPAPVGSGAAPRRRDIPGDARAMVDAALYAAAEDAEIPAGVLRAAVTAMLESLAASGASALTVAETSALLVRRTTATKARPAADG